MGSLINCMTALTKVSLDKTYEYINYYTTSITVSEPEKKSEREYLTNYNNIDHSKYTDEQTNKRILQEKSYYNQYFCFFSDPTLIVDNIYLGSAYNAASYNTLESYNITVIFNITKEITNYYPNNFIYEKYDISDNNSDSIYDYLDEIYTRILYHQENTPGNIFIHCYAGKSRSASIVIYYLIKKYNYTFDNAIDLLLEKRDIINPSFRLSKDIIKRLNRTDTID